MTPPPNSSEEHGTRQDAIAAVFVTEPHETWLPTFTSLAAAEPELRIVAGAATPKPAARSKSSCPQTLTSDTWPLLPAWWSSSGPSSAATFFWSGRPRCSRRTSSVPPCSRCGRTCGSAASRSSATWPGTRASRCKMSSISHQIGDMDEISVTRKLRRLHSPSAPFPSPTRSGRQYSSARRVSHCSPQFPDHGNSAWVSIAECGIRLRARGMVDLLDPSTFVSRPLDMTDPYPQDAGLGEPEWQWLNLRGPGLMRLPLEASEQHAPFREALAWARSEVFGMRIIIDASCLGPKEMGTQVALLALVEALAERDEVEYLGVAIPGAVPAYAVDVLAHPKVDARLAPDGDLWHSRTSTSSIARFRRRTWTSTCGERGAAGPW